MSDYNVGEFVGINPSLFTKDKEEFSNDGFAALVKVVSSRYAKLSYQGDAYPAKLGIKWTMVSTSGTPFDKTYSTGLLWDGPAKPTEDGTRLIVTDAAKFDGLRPNSDGVFLLQQAVKAGFNPDLITDNIAVFDGHCFFIATRPNPNSTGSTPKAYPKKYHPEGFEAALAARNAKKAGQENANTAATMTGSYAPPPIVATPSVSGETLTMAGQILTEILSGNGGKVTHTQIPAKINELASAKGLSAKQRQDVTLALWEKGSLQTVVASLPFAKFDGDTVSMA